jgi:hypothetical protein
VAGEVSGVEAQRLNPSLDETAEGTGRRANEGVETLRTNHAEDEFVRPMVEVAQGKQLLQELEGRNRGQAVCHLDENSRARRSCLRGTRKCRDVDANAATRGQLDEVQHAQAHRDLPRAEEGLDCHEEKAGLCQVSGIRQVEQVGDDLKCEGRPQRSHLLDLRGVVEAVLTEELG